MIQSLYLFFFQYFPIFLFFSFQTQAQKTTVHSQEEISLKKGVTSTIPINYPNAFYIRQNLSEDTISQKFGDFPEVKFCQIVEAQPFFTFITSVKLPKNYTYFHYIGVGDSLYLLNTLTKTLDSFKLKYGFTTVDEKPSRDLYSVTNVQTFNISEYENFSKPEQKRVPDVNNSNSENSTNTINATSLNQSNSSNITNSTKSNNSGKSNNSIPDPTAIEVPEDDFIELLYAETLESLVLVLRNKLRFLDIKNSSNITMNEKIIMTERNITKAYYYAEFIYLILEEKFVQVWNIHNLSEINFVRTISVEEITNNPNASIVDIGLNDEVMILVERASQGMYVFNNSRTSFMFLMITSLFIELPEKPLGARMHGYTLYVLVKEKTSFTLNEYIYLPLKRTFIRNLVFELQSKISNMQLTNDYLITVHDNLLSFMTHTVTQPPNIARDLKKGLAFEAIESVGAFKRPKNNSEYSEFKDFFITKTKNEISVQKLGRKLPAIQCHPELSISSGRYSFDIEIFEFNCENTNPEPPKGTLAASNQDGEDTCSKLDIVKREKNYVFHVYEELFESSNVALAIGLGIGLSLAFIIMIIFCVYFYKIKYKYSKFVQEYSFNLNNIYKNESTNS